ncbi:MAG: hypothetical protein IPK16_08700 [Anaerolineales bacterium]|nr:hypothetical protein [Anaerolineales bacterium]
MQKTLRMVLSGRIAMQESPNEWNRITKRLQMLEAVQEALQIEAENNANAAWVSSSEVKKRMATRGVDVESSLWP